MIKNFRAFSLYMGTLSLPLGMLPLSVYASTSHQSLSTTAVSNFFFNGGTVVNQGTAGSYSQSVEINSGSISNINGAFFAPYCQGAIKFLGPSAYFENDATSQIGPGPVTMQSGLLVNHGTMSLDLISNNGTWVRNQAVSYISGGSLSGSGQMWIAGDATFNTDVSQSKIVLGQGFDLSTLSTPVVAPAKLILNNVLFSSPLTITNQGLLTGSGTVSDLTSQSGVIYPGYNASSLGAIDVLTDVAFSGTLSSLQVSLLGTSANLLKTNQNLSFDPGSKVVLASILSPPKGSTTYTIANFTTFVVRFQNL